MGFWPFLDGSSSENLLQMCGSERPALCRTDSAVMKVSRRKDSEDDLCEKIWSMTAGPTPRGVPNVRHLLHSPSRGEQRVRCKQASQLLSGKRSKPRRNWHTRHNASTSRTRGGKTDANHQPAHPQHPNSNSESRAHAPARVTTP